MVLLVPGRLAASGIQRNLAPASRSGLFSVAGTGRSGNPFLGHFVLAPCGWETQAERERRLSGCGAILLAFCMATRCVAATDGARILAV